METPSYKEDHISQIPALQMLVNSDYMSVINQTLHNKVVGLIVKKLISHYGI